MKKFLLASAIPIAVVAAMVVIATSQNAKLTTDSPHASLTAEISEGVTLQAATIADSSDVFTISSSQQEVATAETIAQMAPQTLEVANTARTLSGTPAAIASLS